MSENKTKEQTEIVSMWTSPETAKLVKKAKDPETKEAILAEYAEKMIKGMESEVEMMDEEVARFKGLMASFKMKFREARRAHAHEMENVWDSASEEIASLTKKCDQVVEVLDPVEAKLNKINASINSINIHRLERLLELFKAINSCYSGESKEIIDFLLKNYKDESN